MRSQDPVDKNAYRRADDDLKKLLYETKRRYFDEMLLNADPTKPYGFNLWKCTRNMKRQPLRKIPIKKSDDTWCRSDSEISLAFADELEKRFQPFELVTREDVEATLAFLDAPSPSMEVCCDNDDTKTRKTGEPCPVIPTDELATHIL